MGRRGAVECSRTKNVEDLCQHAGRRATHALLSKVCTFPPTPTYAREGLVEHEDLSDPLDTAGRKRDVEFVLRLLPQIKPDVYRHAAVHVVSNGRVVKACRLADCRSPALCHVHIDMDDFTQRLRLRCTENAQGGTFATHCARGCTSGPRMVPMFMVMLWAVVMMVASVVTGASL